MLSNRLRPITPRPIIPNLNELFAMTVIMKHKFRHYLYAGNPLFRKLAYSRHPLMIVLRTAATGGYEKRDQLLLFKAGLYASNGPAVRNNLMIISLRRDVDCL